MKKQIIALVSVALVLGLLIAALVLLGKDPAEDGSSDTVSDDSITLYKKDKEDIVSLTVKNEHGGFTINRTGEDTFKVDGLTGYPVNDSNVSSTLSRASSFVARRLIAEGTGDLSVYGLDNPAASYFIKFEDSTYELLIGDEVPGSAGFYVKEKDGDRIYISETSGSYAFWFEKKLGFIDLSLSEAISAEDQTELKNLTLGGSVRPERIVLRPVTKEESEEKDNMDTYKIIEPFYFSPNPDKLSALLSAVSSGLYASEAVSLDVSAKSLKSYGLDKPFSTIAYTLDDKPFKMSIGSKDEESDAYYVLVEGKKVIYKVSASSLTYVDWKLKDLLSGTVLVFIDSVESIHVKTGSKDNTYKLSGEGDDLVVTLNGTTLDTDNFRNLYQLFLGGTKTGANDGDRTQNVPALSITFNFRNKERSPIKSEFYKIDLRNYKKYVNGTPIGPVSVTYIDKVIKSMQDLLDGNEINTNY